MAPLSNTVSTSDLQTFEDVYPDYPSVLYRIVLNSWQSRLGETVDSFYEKVLADINFENKYKQTLLHFMVGSTSDLKMLLARGANVNHVDGRGYTPLVDAINYGRSLEHLQMLIDHGATLHGSDGPALSHACVVADLAVVKLLLNAGADIEEQCRLERTPLFYALMGLNPEVNTQILLDAGADPNVMDFYGKTPYTYGLVENEDGTYSYVKPKA